MGLDQFIFYTKNGEKQEIYYRKINWLRQWMINNTDLQPADNCKEVEIPLTKVQELYDECQNVLTHKTEANTKLPTMPGFFFGSTEYDEDYYEDVKYVKKTIAQLLLDYDSKEPITYSDWW